MFLNTFSLPLEDQRGYLWYFWIEYFWLVFTWCSLLSVNDFTLSSFSINGTIWCNNWQLLNIRSRSCEYYIYTENENLNVNQARLIECDYDFWLWIRDDNVFFEFFKDHLSLIFGNWTSLSWIAWGTKNDIIFLEIV